MLIFITGASGSGKTTVCKKLAQQTPTRDIAIFHFDDAGVPSVQEMIEQHGSPENWQKVTTEAWIEKISKITGKKIVVLEGSFNPHFAVNYAKRIGLTSYTLICLHAARSIRGTRLIKLRNQPELATDDMEHFAQFLKTQTLALGGIVINSGTEEALEFITRITNDCSRYV